MTSLNSSASPSLTAEELRNLNSVTDVLPSWNSGDVAGVLSFYDERILWTNVAMEEAYSGKDEVGGYLSRMLTAFPGLSFRVTHKYPRGHRVAERWVISGEHLGPYLGIPPTGRHVDIHGMSIVHLSEGRFMSDRFYFDTSSVLRDMGLFPTPAVFRSTAGKALLALMARIAALLPVNDAAGSAEPAVTHDDASMSGAESETLRVVDTLISAFNAGDVNVIEGYLATEVTVDNKATPQVQRGRQDAISGIKALLNGVPDAQVVVVQSLVHDNVVACEFRIKGTHLGTLLDVPATERLIDLPGISMLTVEEGRVTDVAIYVDSGMLWRQMGLMPPLSFLNTGAARVSLWLAVNRMRVAAMVLVLGIATALLSRRDRRA